MVKGREHEGYRVDQDAAEDDDVAAFREALRAAAGTFTPEEAEQLKQDIYHWREEGTQPIDRPRLVLTPEERYAALVETLLDTSDADVGGAGKKGFGSDSLTIGGKIFTMLSNGRLVVKLPRQRVDVLVAAGEGQRFDPGHGRVMKEWLGLDPSSALEWLALAQEAMAFVAAKR